MHLKCSQRRSVVKSTPAAVVHRSAHHVVVQRGTSPRAADPVRMCGAGPRIHYGGPVLDVDDLLGPGLADFLSWAEDRGDPVPARCAEVALALLVLRGAPLRGGLPQPAAKLLGQVLREDLPQLVCGDSRELAAYPWVLGLLIDHQRAAGLLNAERHRALHAALRKALPDYARDVRDPFRLTWPRLYGGLLQADGVDVTDQQAVRSWLTDYRSRSRRRAALESAFGAPTGSAGDRTEESRIVESRI